MRCKRHIVDRSSSVGVCASCLRERLLSAAGHHRHCQRPDLPPRPVSPYVSTRKSDAGDLPLFSHHRSFSTSQVDPRPSVSGFVGGSGLVADSVSDQSIKKKRRGFCRLSTLFRAKFDESDSGLEPSVLDRRLSSSHSCRASTTSSSSWSWLQTVISGRVKKQPSSSFIEGLIADCNSKPRRGMSPVREKETEDEPEPPTLASVGESPGNLKRTPARRKPRAGLVKSVSGMAFCLSPLVRVSPSRHGRRRGSLPLQFRCSADSKAPARPHIWTASSRCANRSRKLVDLGKTHHRRE
ncbi:PREDICTED: uncharacterized protein LOC104827680 [Tarenaya hassleriana]|uniref:uncharacterized protein LOC104827680 n=1 Tax=Tarenaya hassleriana TaxID=28532 RepID=UPI00053C887A|nr:PREDICTED: uncharacterized protein LOC104827680 [Tarenaya hassleriana]